MHSLEMLVRLNFARSAKRERRYALALNGGTDGNPKHSEKSASPLIPAVWTTGAEWDAFIAKKKKRKRKGY